MSINAVSAHPTCTVSLSELGFFVRKSKSNVRDLIFHLYVADHDASGVIGVEKVKICPNADRSRIGVAAKFCPLDSKGNRRKAIPASRKVFAAHPDPDLKAFLERHA